MAEQLDAADDVRAEIRADIESFGEYLRERGIPPERALEAGFKVASRTKAANLAGPRSAYQRSAIEIPYRDLDGNRSDFTRLRYLGEPIGFEPSKEQKRAPRYFQEQGTQTPAYLPPLPSGRSWREVAADTSEPIIITEGEVKALAACLSGFTTIGISGVDSWHIGGDKDRLIPGLDTINWKGRNVLIAYDSDLAKNPRVQRAESELRSALEKRGAVVQVLRLPSAADGEKQGLDDYLVAEGADELRKLIDRSDRLPDSLDDGAILLDTEYPAQAFAIDPYLPKGELVELHGAHGQFKSTIMLYAALSVATGERWNKILVPRGRAVFISLEDRTATLARRVRCWLDGNPVREKVTGEKKRSKAEIEKLRQGIRRNFRSLGRERAAPLALTKSEYGQTIIRTANVDRIVKLCQGVDLIVLETAARLHPIDEGNESLAVFASALESIATRTGACVVLVRHISKEQAEKARRGKPASSYAGRGGGSLADAARGVLSVVRAGDDRDAAIKVVHTKSTHTALGPSLLWRVESTSQGPHLRTTIEAELEKKAEEKSAPAVRVLDVIRTAGTKGITRRDLQTKKLAPTAEEFDLTLADLVKTGQVTATVGARKSTTYRAMAGEPTGGGGAK